MIMDFKWIKYVFQLPSAPNRTQKLVAASPTR